MSFIDGTQEQKVAEGVVRVRTFGALALTAAPTAESGGEESGIDITGRARRIWLLVAYLVVHRDRDVSVNELIDLLWPENDKHADPRKTLQHNVSRARDMLQRQGLPNARDLIVSRPGGYRWNPQHETIADHDILRDLAVRAQVADDVRERIGLYKQAISLYRGDFLPGFECESWVAPLSAYYRSLYVSLCLALTRLLSGEENASEIASVCEKALRFAPESEELNAHYIRALTAAHCPEKAVAVYENACKLLNDRLGVMPSAELELAYEGARQSLNGEVLSISSIRDALNEPSFDGEGMRCDWNSFLSLARREARNAKRAKQETVILSISFDGKDSAQEARRVENVLAKRLRSGDVYTRLNSKQFLALLPEAGEKNVQVIVDRLEAFFAQRFPHSSSRIFCDWYSLESPAEPGR